MLENCKAFYFMTFLRCQREADEASSVRKGFLIKLLTLHYGDFLPEAPGSPENSEPWSETVRCAWEPFSSVSLLSQSKRI